MSLTDPPPTTGDHPGGPHRNDDPFPAVAQRVRSYLDDDASGHDMSHAWRVFRLCQRFADDLGADRTIVGCAALVHDLHRVHGNDGGREPRETLDEVRSVLEDARVDDKIIEAVCHCVAVHDEYEFRGHTPSPETVEAEILRDADNLDAMGAVGVARTFAFGGVNGSPMWDPEGETYSHEFLKTFRDRFLAEWHGEL